MNGEMKKLLSLFLFATVLISCVGIVLTGSVVASQTSAENAYGEVFAVMKIEKSENGAFFQMDNKEYPLPFLLREKAEDIKDYIMLTPLSAICFFAESVKDFSR